MGTHCVYQSLPYMVYTFQKVMPTRHRGTHLSKGIFCPEKASTLTRLINIVHIFGVHFVHGALWPDICTSQKVIVTWKGVHTFTGGVGEWLTRRPSNNRFASCMVSTQSRPSCGFLEHETTLIAQYLLVPGTDSSFFLGAKSFLHNRSKINSVL